ncbi:MAG: rhomboid family intramembrane serine protease [Elainellaceae cyanobacterium]
MDMLGLAIICVFLFIATLGLKDLTAESLLYPLCLMLVLILVSESDLVEPRAQFSTLRDLVFIAFFIHFFNFLCQGSLAGQLGIRPRTVRGLVGIVFCPFLHQWSNNSKEHIFGNTTAFITLGSLMVLQIGGEMFYKLTACIALLSGAIIWLLGVSYGVYFGASAVVYGFMAFLVTLAVISGRLVPMLFAIAAVIAYRRLFQQILLGKDSFGHSAGFAAGSIIAILSTASESFKTLLELIPAIN